MPTVFKSHKIALVPTKSQVEYFLRAANCARFTYNWALENWKRLYESGEKPNWVVLANLLNSQKKDVFPWMYDIPSSVPSGAIRNLGKAFSNFFKKTAKYPRFKKKGFGDSFYICGGNTSRIRFDGKRIRLSRIGWVKLREELRYTGKVVKATISRRADRWYASILVEVTVPEPSVHENQGAVGVDLGLTSFAVLSTGEKHVGPKSFKKHKQKLRRLSKSLSRKQLGSKNWHKAAVKRARCYAKITDTRIDYLHKLSTSLVCKYSTIVVEDLHVPGMAKNKHISRAVMDAGFGEFNRQLTYKAAWWGSEILTADRWYPSSKTCSSCGYIKKDLKLCDRIFECPCCGVVEDRDVNAAINLKNLSVGHTETACCLGSSGSSILMSETTDWAGIEITSQMPDSLNGSFTSAPHGALI